MRRLNIDSRVPSPCVDNCCLTEDDICKGCFRSLEEIMQWGQADAGLRNRILQRAEQRKKGKVKKDDK